jgi:hypothetical protein
MKTTLAASLFLAPTAAMPPRPGNDMTGPIIDRNAS